MEKPNTDTNRGTIKKVKIKKRLFAEFCKLKISNIQLYNIMNYKNYKLLYPH